MDFNALVQSAGFPTACVAVIGLALWKTLRWLAPRFEKVMDRHIAFVDRTETLLTNTSKKVDDIHEVVTASGWQTHKATGG
jgi:hypothetical protein